MATKKNINGLANHAASVIIREIGEKHFCEPPPGSFTLADVLAQYPNTGAEAVRNRLDKLVASGELRSGIFRRRKHYWRAAK